MTSAKYSVSIASIAVGTTVAASDAIAFGDFDRGMVYVPAGSSLTTLTWHASTEQNGTYLAAEDATSTAITQTVGASQAHPIPELLIGARFLKITGNAAGVVGVTLKD